MCTRSLAVLLTGLLLLCSQISFAQPAPSGQVVPGLASSVTFRVMVSSYGPAVILTRAVSGRMTVRSQGSIYSQSALDGNANLEFSVPTATASTLSLEVGSHSTRNFSARVVEGFLELTDTDTNARIWYWENGDGTYGFEYYRDTLYVCNQSRALSPILGRISQTSLKPLAAQGWSFATLDSTGDVGYRSSLALDSTGRPHISYYDKTNKDLKYYNGSTGAITTLDSGGDVGSQSSLALDSLGRPHISYYDATNKDLKYYNGATATATTPDSGGDVGSQSSLALDSSGKPHISYHDTTNRDLKYYNGSTATASTLDSVGNVGSSSSLALDSSGKPHIAYYDSINLCLKYYNGSTAAISTLDNDNAGSRCSLALDSSDRPHITYYEDNGGGSIRYYNGATATITSLGLGLNIVWHTSLTLDSSGRIRISYGGSPVNDLKYYNGSTGAVSTLDRSGNVDMYTSLALDFSGRPHISYYDKISGDLKYAFPASATAANGGIYNHFGGGDRVSLPPSRAQVSAGFNTAKTDGTGLNFFRALPFSPGAAAVPALQPLLSGAPGLSLRWTHPDGSSQVWALPCDGSGLAASAGTFTTATRQNNGVPYIDLTIAFDSAFTAGLTAGTHTITYWLWDQDGNLSNTRWEYLDVD